MNTERFQNGLTISSDTVTWGSDLWSVADIKRVWIEPAGESDGYGLEPKGSVDLWRKAILPGFGIGAFSGFRSSTPWIGLIFLALGGLAYLTYPAIRAKFRSRPSAVRIQAGTRQATLMVTWNRAEADLVRRRLEEALSRRS